MSDEQREAAEAGWREAADDAVYDHRNRPFTVELLKAWFGSGVDVGWDAAMAAKAEPVQIDREALAKVLSLSRHPMRWEYAATANIQDEDYAQADAVIAHLAAVTVPWLNLDAPIPYAGHGADYMVNLAAQPVTGTVEWEYRCRFSGNPWVEVSEDHRCGGERQRRRKAGGWEAVTDE
jgi:hypothetical protein